MIMNKLGLTFFLPLAISFYFKESWFFQIPDRAVTKMEFVPKEMREGQVRIVAKGLFFPPIKSGLSHSHLFVFLRWKWSESTWEAFLKGLQFNLFL